MIIRQQATVLLRLLDRRPLLLAFLVSTTALAFNIFYAFAYEIPAPRVHDEFSYILAGETFVNGRLTNETHPMHRYFTSFHIFHEPSYQSKYPPGQGLFLALGRKIAGQPIAGVWISIALACGAISWMARAQFSSGWSIIAGLLPIMSYHLNIHWGQSYWGGGAALLGGALLIGAVFRIPTPTLPSAFLGGAGLFILSITRPMEGLLTAALLLGTCLVLYRHQLRERATILFWMILSIGGASAIIFNIYYNVQLTGDAGTFPHTHWNTVAQMDTAPQVLKEYTGSKLRTPTQELLRLGKYFLGPLAILVFVLAKPFHINARVVMAGITITVITIISIVKSAAHPHYLAPILPLLYFLVLCALAKAQEINRFIPLGVFGAFLLLNTGLLAQKIVKRPGWDWHKERQQIQNQLGQSGKHLVIVQYGPSHSVHHEYVYNAANIDESPVIWAHDFGPQENLPLLRYFKDRTIWLLKADHRPNQVEPYPVHSSE